MAAVVAVAGVAARKHCVVDPEQATMALLMGGEGVVGRALVMVMVQATMVVGLVTRLMVVGRSMAPLAEVVQVLAEMATKAGLALLVEEMTRVLGAIGLACLEVGRLAWLGRAGGEVCAVK